MADYQDRMRERIVQAREQKGYSPEELALRAGVSAKQIRRIENGESKNPHLSTVRAIAEATGKQVTWIRPDLEAEEAALQQQLDRIENMLRRLLGEEDAKTELDADLERAARKARGKGPADKRTRTAPKRKDQAS